MKKALKIAAIINTAIALTVLALAKEIVYPIILTIMTIINISLVEKTNQELYDKKTLITVLSLITLFSNPLSGIILLIGRDKLPLENKTKEKEIKITKEEQKTITLLNIGIGLVSLSGIILITTNWNIISDIIKISILAAISLIFMILSIILEKKIKNKMISKKYWLISALFIILTVIANGYINPISNWFSLNGEGKILYISLISITISLLSIITYNKYETTTYKNISYIGIICSLALIMKYFEIDTNIILILINIALIITNTQKKNKNIEELSKNLTFGTTIISSILIQNSNNIVITSILSVITLINLAIISLKEITIEAILIPILSNMAIISALININNILEVKGEIISLIAISIYSLMYLTNIIKTKINETVKRIMNIATNIIMLILTLINIENIEILVFITTFITLTSILNYYKKSIKYEKILLPIKITVFILSLIALLKDVINIDMSYILITIDIITLIIHKTLKNENTKKISLILYYIIFVTSLSITEELIPCITNILLAQINLIMTLREESKTKQKIAYIASLLSIAIPLTTINILETTYIKNGIIMLLIYMVFLIIFNKKENLKKISYLSIILPLITIMNDQSCGYEINAIITATIEIYIVLLIDTFILKTSKNRNILTAVLIPFIIIKAMFIESWIIGLFIGITALILIIVGYLKKEYKALYIEGIIMTIINLIYQFKYIFTELPLWIYTLLAGLILIGIVTFKIIKENEK